MRWCQSLKYQLPDYRVTGQVNGQFCVTVIVDGLECGLGVATTKKQAEQNAAEILLKTDPRFKNKNGPPRAIKDGSSGPGTSLGAVRGAENPGMA